MDWETRRKKRQEMGGAASGNTSANVESSNSIADAWERRRSQRRQMDAGSEEARRQRSEEIDRINQSRMEQHTRDKAQTLAFAGLRSTLGSLQRAQYDSEYSYNTALMSGDSYEGNSVSNRQNAYKTNLGRIQELNDEIKALEDTAKNRAGGSWYMGHAADRQPTKAEQERIDSLKAERDALLAGTTKYERLRKTQDDYYGVTQEQDFGAVSKNRDFRNPTRDELSSYDARMNGSTYIGADGKTYDVFGDVVDENYYTRFAQPEIVDRLGMFLGASEAEKDQAAGTPLDMEGTWEKVLKDGMDASWDQLSDQEIDIYYYLLNTSGQETADQYLDGMKTELNRRSTNERSKAIDEATGLEKLALNVASVPANVFGGVAGFIEDTAHTLQGKEINPYSAAHSFSNDASAIRAYTAQDFNDMTGNGTFLGISLGDVYQSVMSGADSLVGGYTLGASGYGAAMGMGAATAEAKDLYEKGASKEQVAVGGLLAGVAEGFFEKYSIENLLSMKDAKSIGQLVKNMLVQGGIEFSEELNTELANTISDAIVMGSQSEWSQFIQQHMEDGKSKKEATALAMVDVLETMWKSGVGGFISGFLLGGTGSVASYAGYQSDMRQQGQQILDSGNYDTLQALAMDVAKEGVYGKGESDLSSFAEKTTAGVKNLNENRDSMTQRQVNRATRDVGKLADRVDTVRQQQNAADIQAMLEKKGMSARDSKKAAQLISENYDGLVDPEDKDLQRVMAKPEVRETMKEIADDSNSSVRQRNYRYTLGLMGLKFDENGVVVPVRSKTEEPDAESVTMAEVDKNASVEISDGVSGKMQGIKWDNGILTATVTTEAGETVSAPVEDVSMPSEMQDLVAVSKQFGESAPAVYAAYQPGMGVAEYGAAMKLASDYGYTGVSRSYADSSEYLNGLHPAQISIAYEAGQAAWTKESTETMRSQSKGTVFANRKAGKVSMKGGTVDGVTYKAVDRSGMTAQQKAAVRNITRLAQVTGINFVFYQSEKNSAGKYSGANGIYTDNTIFLDINAGATDSVTEAAILRTAAHELTHFIEQFSKSEYRALQEFMLKNLEGYKGKTIDQLVAEKQARSKKDMSFQDAMSEIVADGCEMMLQDTRIMELLASEHEGIAKKISRWMKNWVEDLKAAFTGVEAVHEEARAMIAHAEELQKLWDNALMQALRNREQNYDASSNYQVEEKNTTKDGGEMKYSQRYLSADTNSEILSMVDKVSNGDFKANEKVYLGVVSDKIADQINKLTGLRVNGFKVAIEARQIDHILKEHGINGGTDHSMADPDDIAKMEYVLSSPDDIRNAGKTRAYTYMRDGRNRTADTVLYEKQIGDKSYYVVQAVPDTKAKTLYIVTAFIGKSGYKKEASQLINAKSSDVTVKTGSANASIDSIRNNGKEVKSTATDDMDIVDSFVSEYKEKHKGIEYSDRDYSYEALTSKPDMNVTLVDDTAPKNRADIIHQAKKNAAGIGTFDPKTGSVSVRVNDINTDVILATNGLKHSMDRRTEVNGPVVVKAGEILQNSIRINELTPQKADAQESYVLIGAAQNNSGELYVVRSVINRFSNELSSMDVLYAINAKKESAALNAPRLADESAIRTDSTISISELLDYVNRYFPDVLPESVLKHYGYDARPEGKIGESALFQDRDTDSISNRAILANALESAAQNDIERKRLEEYRGKIDLLNSEEQKLQGLRSEIRELSFAKGPKDTKRIRELQFEANQTANRINIIDRQLLRLEAAAPLQNVLQREKQMAYKRAEQKGKETLAAYREKATKTQREIISRYQESRANGIDSRKRTAMRHKIQNVVNELNDLLLNESKKRHVPDSLKKAVADALALVNMDTVGAEERIAKLEQEMLKAKTPEKIQEISRRIDNIREMGDKIGQRLKDLRDAYEEISGSDDPDIANAYDHVIAGNLKELASSIGNTSLRNMSIEQLSDVYDMYRMVLIRVRDANKSFLNEKKESISDLASKVVKEVKMVGGDHKYRAAALDSARTFVWNNMKPVYAFEHIGSQTLTEAFKNVRKGEDVWAVDVTEAREYFQDKSRKYHYDAWDFNKQYTFTSTSGMDFRLNLEQILSLYAYSKRDQAHEHLRLGGFVFDSNIDTYNDESSKLIKYKVNTADAHQISTEILENIISKLTPEQKSFVDEMQDYLSTTMGAKGNEVTMQMYGVKLFKEKFYFPLKSAKQFMFEQNEVSGEVKIKNSGFTNKTVDKANNPVILNNFMDVWAGHVNDMAMYHAFALPLEDFNRTFNYESKKKEGQPPVSVKGTIQNAYTPAAVSYVKQLITDLNGGARSDPRESAGKALVGRFKKAAVFASASVVIQQPSAVGRALALIDPKYFDFNPKLIQHKKLWAEVKKYAPVAIIKEMGYFDTDMGMSTVDYIKGEKNFMDKMDKVLSWAPAMADELTWCHIWTAVKRETQAKNPGLSIRSEEFLQKAGARFTEVVVKTQVYDSVLSRSANMRSKNLYMKMLTSFMAEPTTSINMLQSAMWDLKRGYKGKAAKTIGAVVASVVLNSILVSFVYAGRDDDEDETWLEKYASSLATELVEGINPITYIPIAKDIWSLLQGYDVERADMTLFSSVTKSLTKLVKAVSVDTFDMDEEDLADHRKQVVDASWGLVDAVMSMTGIPVKNVRRDVMAAINTYKTVNNGLSNNKTSFWNEIAESVKKSTPVWIWLPDKKKGDKLYDAIVSGDTAYQERVEALYDSQNAIDSARVKALRDNDPRIIEAATAAFNGDPGERVRIAREIVAEGHFSQDDVIRAINAEINKLERAENGGSESEESSPKLYDMNDYYDAVMMGDKATADDAKEYYLDDRIAQGDSEEDALNSFETSFTSTIKSEYLDGKIGKDKVMSLLTTYGGSSESESETYLKKWDFEDKYGYSWDQRDNAFRLGDITMDELVDYTIAIDGDAESAAKFLYEEHEIDAGTAANMLVTYSGMKSDDAKNKVAKWEFKNVYGFSYDDRREAYISGEISAYDLKKSLMDLGGMTSDEADKKIAVYDWRKRNPGTILDDNDIAAYISPIEYIGFSIEESGVSPEVFAEYRNQASKCKGVDADGDGETDSGSMKAQILLVINSLPISAEQKTALYFLNKWAASRLSDAPWY